MAKIVSFVICDSINNINNSNNEIVPTLVAPQIALRPQFIPSNFSFSIAVGISDMDLSKDNEIKFHITNPASEIIEEIPNNILPAIMQKDTLPEQFQGFMINLDIRNLTVKESGVYNIEIFINDDSIGTQAIPIFEGLKDE